MGRNKVYLGNILNDTLKKKTKKTQRKLKINNLEVI